MLVTLLLIPLVSTQWFPPSNDKQNGGLFGIGGLIGRFFPQTVQAISNNNSVVTSNKTQGNSMSSGNLVDELKKLLNQGVEPSKTTWEENAKRFCEQYPQNPKCSNGHLPKYSELGQLMAALRKDVRRLLPTIPWISIRDPLLGVPKRLADILEDCIKTIGLITEKIRFQLLDVCKRINCHGIDHLDVERRKFVRSKIVEFEKAITGKDTTEDVELRLQRTRQVKQALLEKANLSELVTAADDGVFDQDILLTREQAEWLLNNLGKGGVTEDAPMPPTERIKRAALFLEDQPVKKWDITQPIKYTFHDSLEESDKMDIRDALSEISRNVPCIKFQFYSTVPSGSHINYVKSSGTSVCGLSHIGRNDPANPIYLSFMCRNSKGVAIHETMHSLGVHHQHLRMDRDKHIAIDWANIDPRHFDMFAVLDSKLYTTYGVQYDYSSIMHYGAYTAALDYSRPTIVPKVNPTTNIHLLGQRDRMSTNDIVLLKKMYCQPSCVDTNIFCGAWALINSCYSASSGRWMTANCKKSCNVC